MTEVLKEKIRAAVQADSTFLTFPDKMQETLGNDLNYLKEILNFTKNDLIRLERLGFAIKARYETENRNLKSKSRGVTGPHRIRWIVLASVMTVVNP